MSSINPFDEYEAELLAQSRKETQAELQAWEALSPAEKEAEKTVVLQNMKLGAKP